MPVRRDSGEGEAEIKRGNHIANLLTLLDTITGFEVVNMEI